MNEQFRIEFEWLREYGEQLEQSTLAAIRIEVNGQSATRVEDLHAKTVRDRVRGSAYQLACWLVANWWRIRYEPESNTLSWRMSHMLGAIGGGFVWPPLTLNGDGHTLLVQCRPTTGRKGEPIRFLNSFDMVLPIEAFERGAEEFVEAVIGRIDGITPDSEELINQWEDLRTERMDSDLETWRRREALLGYDPDEGPDGLLEELRQRALQMGSGAVEEVASAAKSNVIHRLDELSQEMASTQLRIEIPDFDELSRRVRGEIDRSHLPWRQAEQAARLAREKWELTNEPIDNAGLSRLFNLPESMMHDPGDHIQPGMSAGYRDGQGNGRIKAVLNRRVATGRRFLLARLVADHLQAGPEDNLLPATKAKTARQKFQRAFAQEFLCPYEALNGYMDTDDPADEEIEDAAEHFLVSPLLVRTTLVNKGKLNRDVLE